MKKQTKKQTTAKRQTAKPRQSKPTAPPKAKSKTKPTAKPKKSKPAVAKTPPQKTKPVVLAKPKTAPPKSKPVVSPPPVPVIPQSIKSVMAALPAPIYKPDQSERDELRRIENALAEVENVLAGETGKPVTINSVPAVLIADVVELLEELIDTASPKLASTISRLAYVLCEVMPGLQAVSKRADITLCRKNGVTFGWDRQAEADRAVCSGKYQKSIAVS